MRLVGLDRLPLDQRLRDFLCNYSVQFLKCITLVVRLAVRAPVIIYCLFKCIEEGYGRVFGPRFGHSQLSYSASREAYFEFLDAFSAARWGTLVASEWHTRGAASITERAVIDPAKRKTRASVGSRDALKRCFDPLDGNRR